MLPKLRRELKGAEEIAEENRRKRQREIDRVTNKIQRQQLKAKLDSAAMERQATLLEARTKLRKAETAAQEASRAVWKARYGKVRMILSPLGPVAKATEKATKKAVKKTVKTVRKKAKASTRRR